MEPLRGARLKEGTVDLAGGEEEEYSKSLFIIDPNNCCDYDSGFREFLLDEKCRLVEATAGFLNTSSQRAAGTVSWLVDGVNDSRPLRYGETFILDIDVTGANQLSIMLNGIDDTDNNHIALGSPRALCFE